MLAAGVLSVNELLVPMVSTLLEKVAGTEFA
jgi:hypothetical protein